MSSELLEPAGHLSAYPGLWSCHHQNVDCPKSRLTHPPGLQQMRTRFLESVYFRAVTTITWSAPRDNLVTSRAEHCESPSCCRYLCLYSNSCQVVSFFQSCSLQRHCRIHIAIIANTWVPRNDLAPNFMDDREIDDETFPPGSTSQPSST